MKPSLFRDVTIGIDSYDDLFSDFDPRQYSERAISDDFISEMNKLTDEKDEHVKGLKFQIASDKRDLKAEQVIEKRLSENFHTEHARAAYRLRNKYLRTLLMMVIGMSALLAAATISTIEDHGLWRNMLLVVFEPAGWFLTWTGLDEITTGTKPLIRKRDFYGRLKKSKIEFFSDAS